MSPWASIEGSLFDRDRRLWEAILRVASIAGWILLVAGIVLIWLVLLAPNALAQISPGALSKAHQDLDGPTGCTKCHAVSAGSANFKCLACHSEIASQFQQNRGLHPKYMSAGEADRGCVRCHSEHNGVNFALVKWEPSLKAFDHRKTGFMLDGKHASLTCAQCHNPTKMTPAGKLLLGQRDVSRSYLGLNSSCVSCHEDKHRGQLGPNCTQCHNTTDWKHSFDHSRTKFPLRGAHIQVTCNQCHKSGTDGQPRFTGIKFDRCAACHSDPHRAAFEPQTCESCHNVNSWKQTLVLTRFDHSKTKYPLLGKHAQLGCASCHRSANFSAPIVFQQCADCHKPDPHGGQFAKRADGGKCETCHTVDGFKPAKFTVADHNKTGFVLREAHATTACEKCHVPAGRATLFKVKFAMCTDCHKDVHNGQFLGAPYFNHCEKCHTESHFQPSTFTLALHQKSAFVLTGGHVATPCNECHKPAAGPKTAVFHFATRSCTECHSDPHKNQFASRMATVGVNGRASGCEACHSTNSWNDLERFDHATTQFVLTGSHRAVECIGCHRPPNLERTLAHADFTAAPLECESCHEDAHGSQFARATITRCADCHNTNKWRPSLFDHEKSAFSLKGAHQNVQCKLCHTNLRNVHDKQVVLYKPTPTACASCHANSVTANGAT